MIFFKKRAKKSNIDSNNNGDKGESKEGNVSSNYKEAVKAGSSIAKILTSRWSSQKNPGKVYVGNRRVHHGAIGNMLKLSKNFKNSDPTITGILSGLGDGLVKDDYEDRKEWFKFRKKQDEEKSSLPTKTPPTPSSSASQSELEGEGTNTVNQQNIDSDDGKAGDQSSG
jgi:hypothetical protein